VFSESLLSLGRVPHCGAQKCEIIFIFLTLINARPSCWCRRARGIGFVPGRGAVATARGGRSAAGSRGAGGVWRASITRPTVQRHATVEVKSVISNMSTTTVLNLFSPVILDHVYATFTN